MDKIKLVMPDTKHKEIIMQYKNEFLKSRDSIDGSAGLLNAKSFEEWYEAFKDNLNENTVREGLVPATTYLAINEEGILVGMVDIRHKLNDYLLVYGGNIGYSVRKSQRRKGYATEILRLALEKCHELNLEKVLITCDKENIASAHTIINNNGSLENEVKIGQDVIQRYWINLNNNE